MIGRACRAYIEVKRGPAWLDGVIASVVRSLTAPLEGRGSVSFEVVDVRVGRVTLPVDVGRVRIDGQRLRPARPATGDEQ